MDGKGRGAWLTRLWQRPALQHFVDKLAPVAGRRWFPPLAGLLAFAATLSMTVPTVPLVGALVVLDPRRWLRIALWAVFGSAAGGALFVHVLGHFGRQLIADKLPELAASAHWQHSIDWVSAHGWWAVAFVAASPIAQTPLLFLAAILGMSGPTVFLSLLAGKALKYGLAARLAAKTADALRTHEATRIDMDSGRRKWTI